MDWSSSIRSEAYAEVDETRFREFISTYSQELYTIANDPIRDELQDLSGNQVLNQLNGDPADWQIELVNGFNGVTQIYAKKKGTDFSDLSYVETGIKQPLDRVAENLLDL